MQNPLLLSKQTVDTLPLKELTQNKNATNQPMTFNDCPVTSLNTDEVRINIPESAINYRDESTGLMERRIADVQPKMTRQVASSVIGIKEDPQTDSTIIDIPTDEGETNCQETTKKLPASIAIAKHALAATPNVLSIASIAVTGGTYGLVPTGATLFSLITNSLSLVSTAKTLHSDYQSGFEDFKNMDAYRFSQLVAQSCLDFLASTQAGWGVKQAASGNFRDNKFIVDGLTKSAFSGDWKDYSHAVLGVISGALSALGTISVTRNADSILAKINHHLPENHKISKSNFKLLTTISADIATLGYPIYDCKHTSKLSSYANHLQEFYIPMSASKSTLEAFFCSVSNQEGREQSQSGRSSLKENVGTAANILTTLALLGKTAHFCFGVR